MAIDVEEEAVIAYPVRVNGIANCGTFTVHSMTDDYGECESHEPEMHRWLRELAGGERGGLFPNQRVDGQSAEFRFWSLPGAGRRGVGTGQGMRGASSPPEGKKEKSGRTGRKMVHGL